MWLLLILPFSIIMVVLFSGTIYQTLVMRKFAPNIDTMDELAASNLSILLLKNYKVNEHLNINIKYVAL